jgi:hypothetical protein
MFALCELGGERAREPKQPQIALCNTPATSHRQQWLNPAAARPSQQRRPVICASMGGEEDIPPPRVRRRAGASIGRCRRGAGLQRRVPATPGPPLAQEPRRDDAPPREIRYGTDNKIYVVRLLPTFRHTGSDRSFSWVLVAWKALLPSTVGHRPRCYRSARPFLSRHG